MCVCGSLAFLDVSISLASGLYTVHLWNHCVGVWLVLSVQSKSANSRGTGESRVKDKAEDHTPSSTHKGTCIIYSKLALLFSLPLSLPAFFLV